ncbi:hypothetical protein [Amycolatopsis sp. lyj-112]|uniref:hypothetical protein n=1 Tax=Amycolatopsis sp. lyj-112 TaxID=2789288 RepID=UPI0039781C98
MSVLEPLVWRDDGSSRQEDWQRRLDAFGRRAARELSASGTPTWNTGAGWSVRHTGQFWLVDLDVYEAAQWYELATVRRRALVPGFTPGMTGYIDGKALLLSIDGDIITASCHGNRVLSNRLLSFENATTHERGLRTAAWSWGNSGRWRDRPGKDSWDSLHGHREPQDTLNAEFAGKWRPDRDQSKPPGLGTSMAIKKFLEKRETALPRFF